MSVDKMKHVQQLGFAGAAVLGSVWQSPDPIASLQELLSAAESADVTTTT